MSIKKMMLLASMALALVAFAVPSVASASWTHNHQAIGANAEIHVEGLASFSTGPNSGTECEVTAVILATAGSTTGHVKHFVIGNHNECVSEGAALGGCVVSGATATNGTTGTTLTENPLPLHITTHESGTDLVLTDLTVDTTYTQPDADCTFSGNVLHFAEITLVPDDATTINELTAEGTGTVTLQHKLGGAPIPVGVTAHAELFPTDLNTWGIS